MNEKHAATNGPRTTNQRLDVLEETVAAHSHGYGKVVELAAHLDRNTERLDGLVGEVKGIVVRFEQTVAALDAKVGTVDRKTELIDQKAELADMKATRASLTNEAEPPVPNVDAHPSRAPGERVIADITGDLAVEAFRGARRSSSFRLVALLVAALVGGGAAGTRIQACSSTSSAR